MLLLVQSILLEMKLRLIDIMHLQIFQNKLFGKFIWNHFINQLYQAEVGSIMESYNPVNNVFMTQNEELLQKT